MQSIFPVKHEFFLIWRARADGQTHLLFLHNITTIHRHTTYPNPIMTPSKIVAPRMGAAAYIYIYIYGGKCASRLLLLSLERQKKDSALMPSTPIISKEKSSTKSTEFAYIYKLYMRPSRSRGHLHSGNHSQERGYTQELDFDGTSSFQPLPSRS